MIPALPKEKADELVEAFKTSDAAPWIPKEHALTATNEVLAVLEDAGIVSQFWQEVKEELEKL